MAGGDYPIASPIVNTTANQTVAASTMKNADQSPSIGSTPYTSQQVAAGSTHYAQQCAAATGHSYKDLRAGHDGRTDGAHKNGPVAVPNDRHRRQCR